MQETAEPFSFLLCRALAQSDMCTFVGLGEAGYGSGWGRTAQGALRRPGEFWVTSQPILVVHTPVRQQKLTGEITEQQNKYPEQACTCQEGTGFQKEALTGSQHLSVGGEQGLLWGFWAF